MIYISNYKINVLLTLEAGPGRIAPPQFDLPMPGAQSLIFGILSAGHTSGTR